MDNDRGDRAGTDRLPKRGYRPLRNRGGFPASWVPGKYLHGRTSQGLRPLNAFFDSPGDGDMDADSKAEFLHDLPGDGSMNHG